MRLEYDWEQVARLLLVSRALDIKEETECLPNREMGYHYSASGHELAQLMLALTLDHAHDAAAVYYRSRPFMLGVGMTPETLLAASFGRASSPSEGREAGMAFYKPSHGGVTVLPVAAHAGTQFTPAVGWAQSIRYRAQVLGEKAWQGAITVALGGDGAVATNGFWAGLTVATTEKLPVLFLIEDNGYAGSVPADKQTPGGNIAHNLASFQNLTILEANGSDPAEVAASVSLAVSLLREGDLPVLLRVKVPRLSGHSSRDNQAYRSVKERIEVRKRDPLYHLRQWLVPKRLTMHAWQELSTEADALVAQAYHKARSLSQPAPASATSNLFFTSSSHKKPLTQSRQKQAALTHSKAVTLSQAIRLTIRHEMKHNPHLLLFGQDVGAKGGVYGTSLGLQTQFGAQRVFDTALNSDGIVGRALGMALAGLFPLPKISSRLYLDSAVEQLRQIGTLRWRTANQMAAPMVLRVPIGFSEEINHPWHALSNEASLARLPGWRLVMPSNAQDAVGLLRHAMRGNDPTFFLEHRNLLNHPQASRIYPAYEHTLPFAQAAHLSTGRHLTVVTWGAMVYRCAKAAQAFPDAIELLDLRTLIPWDKDTVLDSVKKTSRCLIVHEDNGLAGLGAEIAATIAQERFMCLDAPIKRLTGANLPVPYSSRLINEVIPSIERIRAAMEDMLLF